MDLLWNERVQSFFFSSGGATNANATLGSQVWRHRQEDRLSLCLTQQIERDVRDMTYTGDGLKLLLEPCSLTHTVKGLKLERPQREVGGFKELIHLV